MDPQADPMDVVTPQFDQDAAGRILLRLEEKDGRSVSAVSASDGTLRFLAILAAIFGPSPRHSTLSRNWRTASTRPD